MSLYLRIVVLPFADGVVKTIRTYTIVNMFSITTVVLLSAKLSQEAIRTYTIVRMLSIITVVIFRAKLTEEAFYKIFIGGTSLPLAPTIRDTVFNLKIQF